jgi:hypothetical protein
MITALPWQSCNIRRLASDETALNNRLISFAWNSGAPMIPFFLYLAAGAVTGFHVYTLLMLAFWGAPVNPLELVSLGGSLCLLVAAYRSLFRPHEAAKLALLASLAIWCFYGSALARAFGRF